MCPCESVLISSAFEAPPPRSGKVVLNRFWSIKVHRLKAYFLPMFSSTGMLEWRITPLIVLVLLIAVVAVGALGYGVGRFVTPPEQTTTTTTETTITTSTSTTAIMTTTTQVSTSIVTVTNTKTTTSISTVTKTLLPRTFPPPANSSSVIRSFYLFDGSVLATLSVDKPVYSLGETVHFKATLTNLTPDYLALKLDFYAFYIENSSRSNSMVWTYPEYMRAAGFGPGPPSMQLFLAPGETKTGGQWSGADWNMKGLHVVTQQFPGFTRVSAAYDDHLVPEGQYTLRWDASIYINEKGDYTSEQAINFTITAKK